MNRREMLNCGVKVTRRKDGGIIIDGSDCKLEKPKHGFSGEYDGCAIELNKFILNTCKR
jgi:hypothetical protein